MSRLHSKCEQNVPAGKMLDKVSQCLQCTQHVPTQIQVPLPPVGTVRLGEVTVPHLDGFDPVQHVKVLDVEPVVTDRKSLEEMVIRLPWTKSARERGERIYWVEQRSAVDPLGALQNHLMVNAPPSRVTCSLTSIRRAGG
jgi:hypothetical protein